MGSPVTQFTIEPPSAAAQQFTIEPPTPPSPSTTWQEFKKRMPGVHDVLQAAGLTPEQMIAQNRNASEHPWETVSKALTDYSPAGIATSTVKSMVSEIGRGIKGMFSKDPIEQAEADLHLFSGMNPFSAPITDVMSQQGLGTKEANATGAVAAATLAAGEVLPRVVPPVVRTAGKVATAASDVVDPDIVGLISPRLAHAQRLAGKIGRVATKLGGPRNLTGNLSDLSAESLGPLPTSAETQAPLSATPSYFETGATPKTNVPLRTMSGREPLLQSLREFEIMNRAVNEMNAQTGEGEDAILAEMNRAGGAWRGKESAVPGTPPKRATAYLKAARNGLPDNAPDAAVAEKAAFLKYQDENLADILQQSIKRAQALRK